MAEVSTKSLKYPEEAYKKNIQGVIKVQMIIDHTGNVSEVMALNDPGYGLAEEAMRVVKSSLKWKPASQNGKNVTYRFIQLITFSIPKLDNNGSITFDHLKFLSEQRDTSLIKQLLGGRKSTLLKRETTYKSNVKTFYNTDTSFIIFYYPKQQEDSVIYQYETILDYRTPLKARISEIIKQLISYEYKVSFAKKNKSKTSTLYISQNQGYKATPVVLEEFITDSKTIPVLYTLRIFHSQLDLLFYEDEFDNLK